MKALERILYAPGARVVHRGIDSHGEARHGRVEEVISEESGPSLVIARWDDDHQLVGFDRRELQRVVTVPLLSRGPMMLYPRHLLNLVRALLHLRVAAH